MKKTKQSGLKLRLETVRQLTGADLRKVAGGWIGDGNGCTCGSNANNQDTCSTYEDTICVSAGCTPQNSGAVCW
jgi:hypothetical protein